MYAIRSYYAVFRLIDRKDKLPFQDWQKFGLSLGLTQDQFDGLRASLIDNNLWQESESLKLIMEILEKMGLQDYVSFNPEIILV